MSLNNRAMEVSGGSSRCAQENCRGVRGKTNAKSRERSASFVVEHMHSYLRARRQRNR
jgi:hypothetical protein